MRIRKDLKERAKLQQKGLVRIFIDGNCMEKPEDRVALDYQAALSDENFGKMREFIKQLIEGKVGV